MPDVIHSTEQYENNRAEQSHEGTIVILGSVRLVSGVGRWPDIEAHFWHVPIS